jgi:hypothetical protein
MKNPATNKSPADIAPAVGAVGSAASPAVGSTPVRPSRRWLVAAFALQAVAWTAWFVIASHHRVQEVPLVRVDGR